VLPEIRQDGVIPLNTGPRVERFDPRKDPGKGGLARPVRPHNRYPFPTFDLAVEPVEDREIAVPFHDIFQFDHHGSARDRFGEMEGDLLLVVLHLGEVDLFQHLDAALHLPRFGGLISEAVDELLRLFGFFLLVFQSIGRLFPAQFPLDFIKGIVPVVDAEAPHGEGQCLFREVVQEGPVVGHQYHCAVVGAQVLFEPPERIEVQVIGGFVQQQARGFLQEQFRQRYPHLPAPRKFRAVAFEVTHRETQPHQHPLHLGLHAEGVQVFKLVLKLPVHFEDIRVFLARVVECFEALLRLFHFRLHLHDVLEGGLRLGGERLTARNDSVLRKVSDRDIPRLADPSVRRFSEVCDDFQ